MGSCNHQADRATMTSKESILERFWEWRLKESPEFATAIGIHDFDDKLDDLSLESFRRREKAAEELLNELEEAKKDDPSASMRLNYTLLEMEIKQYLSGMKFKSFLFPLNQLEGPQMDFPRLISWMKTDTATQYKKILSRFEHFPFQISHMIELLNYGVSEGYTMAIESISVVSGQLELIGKGTVSESKMYKPFLNFPTAIDEIEQKSLADKAKELLADKVFPAYLQLANFLRTEYIQHVRPKPGICFLENGLEYYQECLRFHTSTELTPEKIHNIGKNEVEQISLKMKEVMKKVDFQGSLQNFQDYLKSDPKFHFKNEEDMFSIYNNIATKIKSLLSKVIKTIPSQQYVIEPVPKEIAPGFPGAYYLNPSVDGTRPGTFYLNTYKVEERSNIECVSLSLHEAEPGHHLQCSFAMEQKDLPSFRRYIEDRVYYQSPGRFALNTGYLEGWGLYCEYLGEELHLYENPYDFYGRLSHEMLRACRLVVDTGIHAFGWSREDSIKFMSEKTAMAETDIIAEVDRYITWPGQACAYKIGELKIKELREKAKSMLGESFDVREFHEIVLSLGAVPLGVLEEEVMNFAKKG